MKPNDVKEAREIYLALATSHSDRVCLYDDIHALISGAPPYDPSELEAEGLSHTSNFNTLDLDAFLTRTTSLFWNLINQTEYIAKFTLTGKFKDRQDWARIMSYHFDDIVRNEWKGFMPRINSMLEEAVRLGQVGIMWTDERDWQWKPVKLRDLYLPNQSLNNVDELNVVALKTRYELRFLRQVVEKKSPGWNIEELKKFIDAYDNDEGFGGQIDINEDLQQQEANLDTLGIDDRFDSIEFISLYTEDEKGVHHHMFHEVENYYANKRKESVNLKEESKEVFVYEQLGQYDHMHEALIMLNTDPGAWTVHEAKGVGHKIYTAGDALIKMNCKLANLVDIACAVFFKNNGIGGSSAPVKIVPGVPIDLGSNELVQNPVGANIQAVITAIQHFRNTIQFNLSMFGDDPSTPDAGVGSMSKNQATQSALKEHGLLKNIVAHIYNQFDGVLKNMVSRMLKATKGYPNYEYAKIWKERCKDDGVDPAVFEMTKVEFGLPRHLKVKATRAVGDGSLAHKLTVLGLISPMLGMFSDNEKKELKRLWIEATLGREYLTVMNQEDLNSDSDDISLAAAEHTAVTLISHSLPTTPPKVSPKNDHLAHIGEHGNFAQQIIEGVRSQQIDVIKASAMLEILVPHYGEHVQLYVQNPLNAAQKEQLVETYRQLLKEAQRLKSQAGLQVQAELREREKTQQMNQESITKEQIAQRESESKIAIRERESQEKIARQQDGHESKKRLGQQNIQTQKEIGLARVEAEKEVNLKREENNKKTVDPRPSLAQDSVADLQSRLSDFRGNTFTPYDIEGAIDPDSLL